MRNPPGPMSMVLVCRSAWATRRSGEGCGSHGAVWCSPLHASLKPRSSPQRSVWRSHWCPSKSFRSGGCDGIVNSPYSMARSSSAGSERLAGGAIVPVDPPPGVDRDADARLAPDRLDVVPAVLRAEHEVARLRVDRRGLALDV